MKRVFYFVLLFAIIALASCGSDSDKKDENVSTDEAQTENTTVEQQKVFKITAAGAEIYNKDYQINEVFNKSPYSTEQEEVVEMQEGTEVNYNITKVLKNNKEIAILYDAEKMILTNDFKTEAGIAVGSSIKDFVAAYPEYKIWYSYVSNNFVIETSLLPDAQFILDPLSFLGDENILNESDMVELTIGQMEESGKIQKIRIFEMIGC